MIILLASASPSVSFVLAFLEWGAGLTASVDPVVVSDPFCIFPAGVFGKSADVWSRSLLS